MSQRPSFGNYKRGMRSGVLLKQAAFDNKLSFMPKGHFAVQKLGLDRWIISSSKPRTTLKHHSFVLTSAVFETMQPVKG